MNSKLLIPACVLFASGYFLGVNTAKNAQDETQSSLSDVTMLETKLQQANSLNIQLRDKISDIESSTKTKNKPNTYSNSDGINVSEISAANSHNNDEMTQKITLASAYQALENGNMDEATKQFNALLIGTTDSAERNEIIDGLIAIHEATYQWIVQDGNHLHGAMWQLFEMQKLRPEGQTVNRAKALSKDILNRANEYLDANNLLSGADYLNSLMHTTKMMGYEVEGMPREEIVVKVKEIEQHPQYKDSLYQRASNNLMNGSAIEKNIVFWDFAKLAEIDSGKLMSDDAFNMQFADATLVHLEHLKDINKPGEIKSRQDYIRYAFPSLMKDERISNFF